MKQSQYLLDTNILIYLMDEPKIWHEKLKKYRNGAQFISIISHFEILAGTVKKKFDVETLLESLEPFQVLPFQENLSFEAIKLMKKKSSLKFKDLIIATTAQHYGLELITADRDFKSIPGLKIHLLKL